MFGIKDKQDVKPEIDLKQLQELEKKQKRELAMKEFNGIKSICLNCANAFVQHFLENPEQPDPCTVICKKRAELLRGAVTYYRVNQSELFECQSNNWTRKTLNCSDYEERK